MLERENFTEVLTATIKKYYWQVHDVEAEVSTKKFPGAVAFYLYMTPLFLSRFPMTAGAKEFLYSEYNIRGSLIKYLIGKVGVFAVSNSYGLGAAKKLYIRVPEGISTALFISPCNRTVRFYDFEADTVDCILKDGYKADFLENQLDFRMNCQYPFVPKVLKKGNDWYRERIMHGHALARVRDEEVFEASLQMALSHIATLASDSLEMIDANVYVSELVRKLEGLCGSIPVWEKVRKIQMPIFSVPICMSHGDLQAGNIWVTNAGEVILYDWETCARRSVWYDPITFFCGLRSASRIPILERLKGNKNWLCNDPQKSYAEDQLIAISQLVALEDLLFQLQEANQLTEPYIEKRAAEVLAAFEERMPF